MEIKVGEKKATEIEDVRSANNYDKKDVDLKHCLSLEKTLGNLLYIVKLNMYGYGTGFFKKYMLKTRLSHL